MAVELRCPKCRSKLRLPTTPEPDAEIECPKCEFVFSGEENVIHAGAADEGEAPAKKKTGDGDKPTKKPADEANKPAAEAKKDDKSKPPEQPFKRKKRRAKKKKTNPYMLWSIVGGCVVALLVFSSITAWWLLRKTPVQEMMYYLPADCDEVVGIKLGHMVKYPEFYKALESIINSKGFKNAADAVSKAQGTDTKTLVDLVVQGSGKPGEGIEATVIRTKTPIDPGVLSKLPGAREKNEGGIKYYEIDDIPNLGYSNTRVFAPTDRIVVFCSGNIPANKFKAMLTGNNDNTDATIYKRAYPLVKQVTRGTVWKFVIWGQAFPKPDMNSAGSTDEDNLRKEINSMISSSKGYGIKAGLGSRDVRGEFTVWLNDSDAASSMAKNWKDKDWIKDDDKPRPRWWGTLASKTGAGKKAENALKDNLGFRSSGETFSVKASLASEDIKNGVQTIMNALNATTNANRGPAGPPGGGGGPAGLNPGPVPKKRRTIGRRFARSYRERA